MSVQEELRLLATRQVQQAPWTYEQFEQRHARRVLRRRTAVWSAALSVAALALVSGVAVLTQPADDATRLAFVPLPAAEARPHQIDDAQAQQLPALVNMGQFDITSTLEDHIALLDAELSAARVGQVPEAQLRPMESAREQLSASLQRVSYAHALLSL
jgi:hypothetical protein